MGQNMGLPGGANDWAREVSKAMETIGQLQEMARRICNDFGLDIANPSRGLYTGATPSVDNPVQLKLPSLQDLDIRDAQPGDLLTFDGKRGKWVARRHNLVQIPRPVRIGDPDSYYGGVPDVEEPPVGDVIPANLWSAPNVYHNVVSNPSFEDNLDGWERAMGGDPRPYYSKFSPVEYVPTVTMERIPGAGENGGAAMRLTATAANYPGDIQDMATWGVGIQVPVNTNFVRARIKYDENYGGRVGFYFDTPRGREVYHGYGSNYDELGTWVDRDHNLYYGPLPPEDATAAWVYVGGLVYRTTTAQVLVDSVYASTDGQSWQQYFDGNSTAYHTTYSWDGVANNSTSTAVQNQRLCAPAEFPENSVIEVRGEGFKANSTVYIAKFWEWGAWKENIPTDATGSFTTTLDVGAIGAPASANLWAYDADWNGAFVPVQVTGSQP